MFQMKFMDGTPVPDDYARRITKMVNDACEAEDRFGLDELEEHARKMEKDAGVRAARGERGG